MNKLNFENHPNIKNAQYILEKIGMDKPRTNLMSASILLALGDLSENKDWKEFVPKTLTVKEIQNWIKDKFDKLYDREAIRRETLHQFRDGGIVIQNPDDPGRPTNSPHNCYCCNNQTIDLLKCFNTKQWNNKLIFFKENVPLLIEQYRMEREQYKNPVQIDESILLELTPGMHNELIKKIILDFAARFAKNSKPLYIGDAGQKNFFFKEEEFQKLGLNLNKKGKLPDVVLYSEDFDWIFLVEAVTSSGPVDSKRKKELEQLFGGVNKELIFVTAFLDRKMMKKFVSKISWESEVWIADNPSHMIHFNGDKFLGTLKK